MLSLTSLAHCFDYFDKVCVSNMSEPSAGDVVSVLFEYPSNQAIIASSLTLLSAWSTVGDRVVIG